MRRVGLGLLLISAVVLAGSGGEDEKILNLALGNPDLKEKTLEIFPGKIYSTESGDPVSFERMIGDLARCRIIYVGETHNSLPMHRIQAEIIRGLYELDRGLSIGMEMFNVEQQTSLNKWSLGILDEKEFIRDSRWYIHWNFHYHFYRDIMEESRHNHIPIYALNAPREIITSIRMRGWEALDDKDKEWIPKPDLSHKEHRALIRAVFENMEMPPQMKGPGLEKVFEGLYRAQSAWDEIMASQALKGMRSDGRRMVLLAGSGHLLYNLGINRRLFEKNGEAFKTVLCVVIPKGEANARITRSVADYIYALPAEDKPAYPSLGLSFKHFQGLKNPVIDRDPINGAAKGAGFKKGDVVLSVNNHQFFDINELRIFLSVFSWGDTIEFTLLRNAAEKTIRFEVQWSEEEIR